MTRLDQLLAQIQPSDYLEMRFGRCGNGRSVSGDRRRACAARAGLTDRPEFRRTRSPRAWVDDHLCEECLAVAVVDEYLVAGGTL